MQHKGREKLTLLEKAEAHALSADDLDPLVEQQGSLSRTRRHHVRLPWVFNEGHRSEKHGTKAIVA